MFCIVELVSGIISKSCTSIAGSKLIDYVVLYGLLLIGLSSHVEEDVALFSWGLEVNN